MSESTARPRPLGVEAQLRAMANATDRANRPTGLLIIGVVVAVGFGLYALTGVRGWTSARSSFSRTRADAATVDRMVRDYTAIKSNTPDLNKLFPPLATMGADIERWARKTWGVADGQPVPGITVGRKQKGNIFEPAVESRLELHSVEATIADQPLEKITQWIRSVENDSFLGPTFVSSLSLSPAGAGWQGSVRFSTYERKPQ